MTVQGVVTAAHVIFIQEALHPPAYQPRFIPADCSVGVKTTALVPSSKLQLLDSAHTRVSRRCRSVTASSYGP